MQQAEPSSETLASIRLAVFDFDGVFTDNYVWVDGDGGETARCCRADGLGLEAVAYVGNDVNDVDCVEAVGLPVCPADAWPEAREVASWVLERAGGEGCVREFCDAVWMANVGARA